MKFLEHIKQTNHLSVAEEKEFLAHVKSRVYKKGEFLFKEGDYCRKIYIVESGLARLYYFSEQGKEVTVWLSVDNYYVTAVDSFMKEMPTRNYCEALEDSIVYEVSQDSFEQLINTSHALAKFSFRTLFDLTTQLINNIDSLKFQTAKEKYVRLQNQQPSIFQKVPLQYIASYLGITPETLSRLRAEK